MLSPVFQLNSASSSRFFAKKAPPYAKGQRGQLFFVRNYCFCARSYTLARMPLFVSSKTFFVQDSAKAPMLMSEAKRRDPPYSNLSVT